MAKWMPLQPAAVIRDQRRIEALIRDSLRLDPNGKTEEELRAMIEEELLLPVWKNWLYQVAVRRVPTEMPRDDGKEGTVNLVHLSIRSLDRRPARDWRDLQLIKNQLIGPECEAVELFPAEARLVDTANQTHLWGFDDPGHRFPFGFNMRLVDDTADPAIGHRQRKLAR